MVNADTDLKPKKIILRSYQVGFGDCFLLIFQYANNLEKFVLIDFGTTGLPDKFPKDQMLNVAKNIAITCRGKLNAVVATHRHKDHLSGFSTEGEKTEVYFKKSTNEIISQAEAETLDKKDVEIKKLSTGEIIKHCQPEFVIQPWTENPNLTENARSSSNLVSMETLKSNEKVNEFQGKKFGLMLNNMHNVASTVSKEAKRLGAKVSNEGSNGAGFVQPIDAKRQHVLEVMGENNMGENDIKNRSAVLNLRNMGKTNKFVNYGSTLKTLEATLGIKIHVLGPPTIDQYEKVQKQRSRDDNEFWMITASLLNYWKLQSDTANLTEEQLDKNNNTPDNPFPHAKVYDRYAPSHTRWFIRRMRNVRAEQLLGIVTILDKAMNNTSVILLFEVGKKKLLFPGDAQIENWEYVLKHKRENEDEEKERLKYVELLKDTTLYKVGHHGSRNATPKTLWNNFRQKTESPNEEEKKKSMFTVNSTMEGKHGHTEETKVPRKTLVDELEKHSQYRTTQELTVEKETDVNVLDENRWLYFDIEV